MSTYAIVPTTDPNRSEIQRDAEVIAFYDASTNTVVSGKKLGPRTRHGINRLFNQVPGYIEHKWGTVDFSPETHTSAVMEEPSVGFAADMVMPGMSPDGPQGDKTPEFVEWLLIHDREAFIKRYRGRKIHLFEKPFQPEMLDDL